MNIEPNNDEVICPSCAHQFRAIPVNVQSMLKDAGYEPPFKAPPFGWTPIKWPKNRDLFIRDDMGQGQLRVLFDGDNDVIIAIWPEGNLSASLEFCTSGQGGGKSPNVRKALIALMVAMEQDGAKTQPDGW